MDDKTTVLEKEFQSPGKGLVSLGKRISASKSASS